MAAFRNDGSGYLAIQNSRPQTIGYGLVDSPVLQLAWIAEKVARVDRPAGRPRPAAHHGQPVLVHRLRRQRRAHALRAGALVATGARPADRATGLRGLRRRRDGTQAGAGAGRRALDASSRAGCTSRRWRRRRSWPRTCGRSSARSPRRVLSGESPPPQPHDVPAGGGDQQNGSATASRHHQPIQAWEVPQQRRAECRRARRTPRPDTGCPGPARRRPAGAGRRSSPRRWSPPGPGVVDNATSEPAQAAGQWETTSDTAARSPTGSPVTRENRWAIDTAGPGWSSTSSWPSGETATLRHPFRPPGRCRAARRPGRSDRRASRTRRRCRATRPWCRGRPSRRGAGRELATNWSEPKYSDPSTLTTSTPVMGWAGWVARIARCRESGDQELGPPSGNWFGARSPTPTAGNTFRPPATRSRMTKGRRPTPGSRGSGRWGTGSGSGDRRRRGASGHRWGRPRPSRYRSA